jgi:hypothetical protein
MSRRVIWLLSLFIVLMGVTVQPATAGKPPLPSLPPRSVRTAVLSQTNGAQFTPIGVAPAVTNWLNAYGGVFADAENMFDLSQAVHYVTHDGRLTETILPLRNSGSKVLRPNMTAPGATRKPGRIIGALFQPTRGMMIVVAVWKDMNAVNPEKLRFYYNDTLYFEAGYKLGNFLDINGDHRLEPVDVGGIIAHNLTCVAVGLKQVCWAPYNSIVRSNTSRDLVHQAYEHMRDVYEISVDVFENDAVPDLYGRSSRVACANQMASATSFENLTDCIPTAVFTATKELRAGQPIAIMRVLSPVDVRAYTAQGTYVGTLPPGDYAVMDGMPTVTEPGQPTLLFLVNADGVNHFLVPSVVQQGYGRSDVIDERRAALRDGLMSWRGVGY